MREFDRLDQDLKFDKLIHHIFTFDDGHIILGRRKIYSLLQKDVSVLLDQVLYCPSVDL